MTLGWFEAPVSARRKAYETQGGNRHADTSSFSHGRTRRVFEVFGPRRSHWGTDLTNAFAKADYRQRISHFTETLTFMSEEDKDWVMGRSILERLKWG